MFNLAESILFPDTRYLKGCTPIERDLLQVRLKLMEEAQLVGLEENDFECREN